jgi:DNA-binding LacI/PurR family transcriptional regulator
MSRHRLAALARVLPGGHTEEEGLSAARLIAGLSARPTAVVAFNDRVAVGLLDAFRRAGLAVPADMSLVGYDDSPLSRLAHIGLTTVSQASHQLTRHAVAAIVERLEGGRTGHREVVLPPELVVRTTSGPPPAARPSDSGPAPRSDSP